MNPDYNEIIVKFESLRMAEISYCHFHSIRTRNEFDK